MKDKLELLLLLLLELAGETILVFTMSILLVNKEIIPAIITMFPALFYAWEMIDTFKMLIDLFKQNENEK